MKNKYFKGHVFIISDNLDKKGNIVQHITRPIVPSGGVLKDINEKIEKIQHDSLVSSKISLTPNSNLRHWSK